MKKPYNIKKGISKAQEDPGFDKSLIAMSKQLGVNPDSVRKLISMESGGITTARNPMGTATGITQITDKTARSLGTTANALRSMSATKQLEYAFKYWNQFKNKIDEPEDLYLANFYPAALGKPDDYILGGNDPASIAKLNPGLDLNKDSRITVGEVKRHFNPRYGQGVKIDIRSDVPRIIQDRADRTFNQLPMQKAYFESLMPNLKKTSIDAPVPFMKSSSISFDKLLQIYQNPHLASDASFVSGFFNEEARKGKKNLSRAKAREILHDGTVHGKKITENQRRYFGAIASGYAEEGIKNTERKPITLQQVDINGISPRQQAYNDSLRRHNASMSMIKTLLSTNQPLQDSADVANKLYNAGASGQQVYYNNQYEADRKNALLKDSFRIDRYEPALSTRLNAYKKMNKYYDSNHKPTEEVLVPQVEVGVGGGSITDINHILTFKKPVVNPSENHTYRMQQNLPQIESTQQSINPQKVKMGFKGGVPGYNTLQIQYNKDGKPMYYVNKVGGTMPIENAGEPQKFTKEFLYPKMNKGGKNVKKYKLVKHK